MNSDYLQTGATPSMGKGRAPKEFKTSAEIKKAISENVKAIGYIDRSDVDDSARVVASIP